MKKTGRHYRDQYFDNYFDFIRRETDENRRKEGKKPYSDATVKTWATDTFYLERHESRNFLEWLKNEETFKEAEEALIRHFKGRRRNPKKDAESYVQRMRDFKKFLEENDGRHIYLP